MSAPASPPARTDAAPEAPDPRLDAPPGLGVRLLIALARALLPLRAATPPRPDEMRRVLVVRTDDRVGNALLTIPLARALASALPHARVDLLLASRRAAVAEGLAGLHVLRFEKADAFRAPLRLARALLALRRANYDLVVDAAHWHAFSATSALVARFAARRFLVGPRRGPRIYSAQSPLPPPGLPEVEAKVALLSAAGLPAYTPPMETSLGKGAPPPLAQPFAALNPGSRKLDRRWPAERFAALARALHAAHGLRSVVLWGPGEEPVARAVAEGARGCAALAPPTNLDELAAVLRRAALVVTTDTGPMHLAVACGAPVVAIFPDEAALRWRHPGTRFAPVVAPQDERAVAEACARLLALTAEAAQHNLPASSEGA